jgi:type VI secretion system lysozyme-like protein
MKLPLFERLAAQEPDARHDSIAANLNVLLNTRTAPGAIVEYGLPDLSGFYAGNEGDRVRLAQIVAGRIERYEPRLCAVRVTLRQDRLNPRALLGEIQASLASGGAVSFPFALDAGGGAK